MRRCFSPTKQNFRDCQHSLILDVIHPGMVSTDGSLADIFGKLVKNSCGSTILDRCCFSSGITEFCGPSGSGKSSLIYQVIVSALLPRELGGQSATVAFFDLDGRFSIQKLVMFLNSRMKAFTAQERTFSGSESEMVRECLERTLVYQPTSELELSTTLQDLESCFKSTRGSHFVVLESLSSLYWQARASGDQGAILQAATARAVRKLVIDCNASVLAVKPTLFSGDTSRDFMSKYWQGMVSTRIILTKPAHPQKIFHLRVTSFQSSIPLPPSTVSLPSGDSQPFVIEDTRLKFF